VIAKKVSDISFSICIVLLLSMLFMKLMMKMSILIPIFSIAFIAFCVGFYAKYIAAIPVDEHKQAANKRHR